MRPRTILLAAAALPLAAGCGAPSTGEPTAPSYVVVLPSASIGDRLWIDADGDGLLDAGETGAAGWAVTLTGPTTATRTTTSVGAYTFSPLPAGSFRVCVTPRPGYTATWDADGTATPNCAVVNLTAGRVRTDVDFGYRQVPGELGGRVWNDANGDGAPGAAESGLASWVVHVSGASLPGGYRSTQSTDAAGRFRFTGLPTGTYRLCVEARAGYVPTSDPDGAATPGCATVTLGVGEVRGDANFGYWQPSRIGDRVWDDANGNRLQDVGEAGLAGWTVTISGASLPAGYAAALVTGANGTYGFGSLPAGNYRVCVMKQAGYTQTYDLDGANTADCAYFTLPAGTDRSDVDFGYRR